MSIGIIASYMQYWRILYQHTAYATVVAVVHMCIYSLHQMCRRHMLIDSWQDNRAVRSKLLQRWLGDDGVRNALSRQITFVDIGAWL